MEAITVKGQQFEIPSRYQEGQEMSAGDAKALQGIIKAKSYTWILKKLKNGSDPEEVQSAYDTWISKYQLGQRVGGGPRVKDPAYVVALRNAVRDVRGKIRQAGGKLKDVRQGLINKRAREWVADPDRGYMEQARKELKKAKPQQVIDDDIADLLGF